MSRPINQMRIAGCLGVYLVASIVMGRDILAQLGTAIANDAGDPLLTTAILHWVATHVPYSDAWYQLPIFYPSRDTLTFSEHLLGVAVVSAPLEWVTGSPIVAYNLTLIASFALSAAAMFALAYRLTGRVAAAFISGLAYGFAPYRISQLPHIQMEVLWYAPLALLGLHAYLQTGKWRWLALYGVAWMLQGAANGYALVFLSVLVGLWGLWFVVLPRRWRDAAAIAAATVIAVVPLAPILLRYVSAHSYYGMVRNVDEIRAFSADIAGLLCAPPALAFWGWIRVGCRAEGELFPGVAAFAILVVAAVSVVKWAPPAQRSPLGIKVLIGLLLATAVVYGVIAATVLALGPWVLAVGPLHASASSVAKPLVVSIGSALLALVLAPRTRLGARQLYPLTFYVVATIVMWLLALGPSLRVMDRAVGYGGPYRWVMLLPGADGLRVPARFWMVAILCLATVIGLYLAELLRRRPHLTRVAVPLLAVAVLADGWSWVIPVQPLPPDVPTPSALVGRTVLDLPIGDYPDIGAQYRAITGGWRSANGYSGFAPPYYPLMATASMEDLPGVLDALQPYGELNVVVARDASVQQSVLRAQPGVAITGENRAFTQFRLPARPEPSRDGSVRVPIASVSSPCEARALVHALDRDRNTAWVCGPELTAQQLTIDLGSVHATGALRHDQGFVPGSFPGRLVITTSEDGTSWVPAWAGDTSGLAIRAMMREPKSNHLWVVFEPRPARYVRLTHPAETRHYIWTIAELDVWSR